MKFYLLLLTSFLFACNSKTATTSHTPKGTSINASGYARVISDLGADISIEVNPDSPYYCYLQCEKEIEQLIAFDIINDELHIDSKKDINTREPIIISMRVKELKSINNKSSGAIDITGFAKAEKFDIDNLGSGKITLNHLQSDLLKINSNGSGNVTVDGRTKELITKLSGSGNINAFGLKTDNASSEIVGSGNIEVSPISNLDAKIVGSGNIYYKGSPNIKNNITGSGMLSAK